MSKDITESGCATFLAEVWLLLDGECDEATQNRVEAHMHSCADCLSVYGVEEKVKLLLSTKCGPESAPAGLRERLQVEIRRTVTRVEYERGE